MIVPRPLPIIDVEPTNPEIITILPIIEEQQASFIGTGVPHQTKNKIGWDQIQGTNNTTQYFPLIC